MSEKLIQPSGTHSDEPRAAASRMPHYFFLGRRVCRASLAVLMGVGWSPRLSNLLKAVLRGDRAAPVDVRYMTRKHNDPTPVFSEVFSYLQNLYMSVAETLPLDEKNQRMARKSGVKMKMPIIPKQVKLQMRKWNIFLLGPSMTCSGNLTQPLETAVRGIASIPAGPKNLNTNSHSVTSMCFRFAQCASNTNSYFVDLELILQPPFDNECCMTGI